MSDFLPLIKLLAAFAVMVAGIRFRLGIGLSILLGAVLLSPLFLIHPLDWLAAAWDGLTGLDTGLLALIVFFILILSDLMESTGQARRLMDSLTMVRKRPRIALAFFPAMIGLLPMPGGAVFSAPMVDNVAQGREVQSEGLVVVNYWFRHLWEPAWPLYPGIILASTISGLPLTTLVLYMLPGPLVYLALGWIFFLRPGRLGALRATADIETPKASPATAFLEGLPLMVAIIGGLGLEVFIANLLPDLRKEVGVIIALAAAAAVLALRNRVPVSTLLGQLGKKKHWQMLFVIAAIFVFKETLRETHAVDQLANLAGEEAALLTAGVFLPFLVGMIAGVNMAFVGAAFPLLIGIVHTTGQDHLLLPYIVLGMFSGFSGVMISPVHLCFLLTCQYFRVELAGAWRRLVWPCLLFAAFGFCYFLFLRTTH